MTVTFSDAEPNGLAELVGGLIEANLGMHPSRRALLRPSRIRLTGRDADVTISLALGDGNVIVSNGPGPRPHLHVEADASALLALASAPLRFGLPDALRAEGRAVLRSLLRSELRVVGLLRHPLRLSRFSRLLSVA